MSMPVSTSLSSPRAERALLSLLRPSGARPIPKRVTAARSEERRVGKECRSRWVPDQAEDGIRDLTVTGVQTCALPISAASVADGDHQAAAEAIVGLALVVADEHAGLDQLVLAEGREGALELVAAVGGEADSEARDGGEIGRASCRERV